MMDIARSALLTQQKAMGVTGHNIANANTPGYSRQIAQVQAADPLRTPIGTIGRGVTLMGIDRARGSFLDNQVRAESGGLGYSTSLRDTLNQVQDVFGEPSTSGLGAGIDSFFSAWSDVANDPSAQTPRNLLRQSAQSLTDRFHQMDDQLAAVGQNAQDQFQGAVDTVNSLTKQIAQLNGQIQSSRGTGGTAADLQDQRDLLIDQLSQMVQTRVVTHDDGSVGVVAGGTLLVDAGQVQTLQVVNLAGGGFGARIKGSAGVIDTGQGQIGALSEFSTTELPAARARLDALAGAIVAQVNQLHQGGTNLAGATNVAFFDPAGTTAHSIALSAPVQASLNNIAAGATAVPGDGAVALQLSQLGGSAVAALGGQTIRGYYNDSVSIVASQVSDATASAQAQSTMVSNMDAQRTAQSGVSVDEELTRMIEQQQAYQAAARMVSVADQMMQTVLQMVS
jgi:flagellar hook-associated protein 1 FlgK